MESQADIGITDCNQQTTTTNKSDETKGNGTG